MKRSIFSTTVCCAVLSLCATGLVAAEDSALDGRALYREHCKDCHTAGSPNGEYTPMTLIGMQWERFFDRKYERKHKEVVDEAHGGKPVTESITVEELKAIRDFAVDHAADSENPMTCG